MGREFLANGDSYHGQYRNGMRHGRGVFKSSTQVFVYEGCFAYDRYHGEGRIIKEDGSVYEGSFFKGKKHG